MNSQNLLEKVISLCKRKGFIFPGSEIYGGLSNTWDYGPLGSQLKKNIKDLWWKTFVEQRTDIVGLDSAILMNPTVWEASGHVFSFSDPLMDCRKCKSRERADKLIESWITDNQSDKQPDNWAGEKTPSKDLLAFINNNKIKCPKCGKLDWTEPKAFNLMFKTKQGVIEDEGKDIYLRPETAQGIFVNFKNVQETTRKKLPFGIAQIGKSFRNEITPKNYIFRTREFEQMEIEYFFDPENSDWKKIADDFRNLCWKFYHNLLGINQDQLRFRDHAQDELSHYSKGTTDLEFNYPFGWGELGAAYAYRTDYDLSQHQEYSKQNLKYKDQQTGKEVTPHVIEPSYGLERAMLAVLLSSYDEEKVDGDEDRVVMRFKPYLAPTQVAVLPLSNKLSEQSQQLADNLSKKFRIEHDQTGSIGKRYRRQDEIGTPYCVTYDFDSEKNQTVTIRDRDTMKQVTVNINNLVEALDEKFRLP